MKVIIEIPSKYLETAKGLMLASCETEKEEQELTEYVEGVKAISEPMLLDLDIEYKKDKATIKQLYIGLACFSIGEYIKKKHFSTAK